MGPRMHGAWDSSNPMSGWHLLRWVPLIVLVVAEPIPPVP